MIVGGMMMFLLVNPIFNGTGGTSKGLFDIAADDMGIDNSSGTTMNKMQTTWVFVPWSFVIGGLLFILVDTQRREPYSGHESGPY